MLNMKKLPGRLKSFKGSTFSVLFVSAKMDNQWKACQTLGLSCREGCIWPSCVFMEKTKSCKGKHLQCYVCVGPNPLTELYGSYILHSIWCFLNFGLHIPRPRQEEPPAKCYAEVVIMNRISANSYDIVQAYSYSYRVLLLTLAIASTLMQIVPIVSSQSVYIITFILSPLYC